MKGLIIFETSHNGQVKCLKFIYFRRQTIEIIVFVNLYFGKKKNTNKDTCFYCPIHFITKARNFFSGPKEKLFALV